MSRGARQRGRYPLQVCEISAVALGHHAENEALENGFFVVHVRYRLVTLVALIGAETGIF